MNSRDPRSEVQSALADVRGAFAEAREAVAGARETVAGIGPLLNEVVRTVTDVDTIKALADPTRLAILRVLGRTRAAMTAKELAEALNEPQTKLYRHLKVLQEKGLIEVAEQRIVSGIVETRYRAAQTSLHIDPSDNIDATGEEMLRIIQIDLDSYRDRFISHVRSPEFAADKRELKQRGTLMTLHATVAPELAIEFQQRLEELIADFDALPDDPNGTEVEGLVSWFSRKGPQPESE